MRKIKPTKLMLQPTPNATLASEICKLSERQYRAQWPYGGILVCSVLPVVITAEIQDLF